MNRARREHSRVSLLIPNSGGRHEVLAEKGACLTVQAAKNKLGNPQSEHLQLVGPVYIKSHVNLHCICVSRCDFSHPRTCVTAPVTYGTHTDFRSSLDGTVAVYIPHT